MIASLVRILDWPMDCSEELNTALLVVYGKSLSTSFLSAMCLLLLLG